MHQEPVPLKDSWTFWYAPRGKNFVMKENYLASLKCLGTAKTVQDFFSIYCYLKRPSEIPIDHKILMFRESTKPTWEDSENGGCWILMFKKREDTLNKTWENLLLSLISEELEAENSKTLLGVVLSVREKRNVLEIWIQDGTDEDLRVKIGERLREALDLNPSHLTFYFKVHSKSLKDMSFLKGAESYTFISTPLETPLTTPKQTLEDGKPYLDDLQI